MLRLVCATALMGLSFAASAEPVVLRCTFVSGTYAGQSGYIGLLEEKSLVVVGNAPVPATFSDTSIEWSTDGKSRTKFDRVTGDLYFQVRQAPFKLAANCIVSPSTTKF